MSQNKLFVAFSVFFFASVFFGASVVRAHDFSYVVEFGEHFSRLPSDYFSFGFMNVDSSVPRREGVDFIWGLGARRDHFFFQRRELVSALALWGRVGISIPVGGNEKKISQALDISGEVSAGEATLLPEPFLNNTEQETVSSFWGYHPLIVTYRAWLFGASLRGPGVLETEDGTIGVPAAFAISFYLPW